MIGCFLSKKKQLQNKQELIGVQVITYSWFVEDLAILEKATTNNSQQTNIK